MSNIEYIEASPKKSMKDKINELKSKRKHRIEALNDDVFVASVENSI